MVDMVITTTVYIAIIIVMIVVITAVMSLSMLSSWSYVYGHGVICYMSSSSSMKSNQLGDAANNHWISRNTTAYIAIYAFDIVMVPWHAASLIVID